MVSRNSCCCSISINSYCCGNISINSGIVEAAAKVVVNNSSDSSSSRSSSSSSTATAGGREKAVAGCEAPGEAKGVAGARAGVSLALARHQTLGIPMAICRRIYEGGRGVEGKSRAHHLDPTATKKSCFIHVFIDKNYSKWAFRPSGFAFNFFARSKKNLL